MAKRKRPSSGLASLVDQLADLFEETQGVKLSKVGPEAGASAEKLLGLLEDLGEDDLSEVGSLLGIDEERISARLRKLATRAGETAPTPSTVPVPRPLADPDMIDEGPPTKVVDDLAESLKKIFSSTKGQKASAVGKATGVRVMGLAQTLKELPPNELATLADKLGMKPQEVLDRMGSLITGEGVVGTSKTTLEGDEARRTKGEGGSPTEGRKVTPDDLPSSVAHDKRVRQNAARMMDALSVELNIPLPASAKSPESKIRWILQTLDDEAMQIPDLDAPTKQALKQLRSKASLAIMSVEASAMRSPPEPGTAAAEELGAQSDQFQEFLDESRTLRDALSKKREALEAAKKAAPPEPKFDDTLKEASKKAKKPVPDRILRVLDKLSSKGTAAGSKAEAAVKKKAEGLGLFETMRMDPKKRAALTKAAGLPKGLKGFLSGKGLNTISKAAGGSNLLWVLGLPVLYSVLERLNPKTDEQTQIEGMLQPETNPSTYLEDLQNQQFQMQQAAATMGQVDPRISALLQSLAQPPMTSSETYIGPNHLIDSMRSGRVGLDDLLAQLR